jgi:tetratricopeptide (TPR) repeat protein
MVNTSTKPSHRASAWVLRGILILGALVVYQGVPDNGFHFDDKRNIVRHEPTRAPDLRPTTLLRAWQDHAHPRRPLASVTFAVDWARGGGSPRTFLWTNLLIHIAASLSVFELIRLLLRRTSNGSSAMRVEIAAGLSALTWSLHPIQLQAVTYIVQRMATLASLGTITCVVLWVNGRRRGKEGWPWLIGAGLAAFVAVTTKEISWVLPGLLILAELALVRPPDEDLASRRVNWLLGGLAVIAGLAAVALVAFDLPPLGPMVWPGYAIRDFGMLERLMTQPRVILVHLSQILAPGPSSFSVEHPIGLSTGLMSPPSTLLAGLFVVSVTAMGCRLFWRPGSRVLGFFMLWLPATMLIEFTIVPLELIFEHRMYLPTVGLVGLLGVALLRVLHRSRIEIAAVGAALAVYLALCVYTNRQLVPVWRSEVTLWEHVTTLHPDSHRGWNNLCSALLDEDRPAEARVACGKALAIEPDSPEGFLNLGVSYMHEGLPSQALTHFGTALRLGIVPRAHNWIATAYRELGMYDLAAEHYRLELSHSPGEIEVRVNLGGSLFMVGDIEGALEVWEEALERRPDHAGLLFNIGRTLRLSGRMSEARPYLERFLRTAGESYPAQQVEVRGWIR